MKQEHRVNELRNKKSYLTKVSDDKSVMDFLYSQIDMYKREHDYLHGIRH